jgi:hypothetical protein
MNASTTLIEFNHPPDLGSLLKTAGKSAKIVNGRANARPKANIPIVGRNISPLAASTRRPPTIGPVHENETITVVSAIKKEVKIPPLSTLESALVTHLFGRTISNAPKNDMAKNMKRRKNIKFGIQCVLKVFAKPAPAPVSEIIIPGEV